MRIFAAGAMLRLALPMSFSLLLGGVCFAATDSEKTLVGVWDSTNSNEHGSKRWTINPDGKFTMFDTPANGGDAFGFSGRVTFRNGICSLRSDSSHSSSESAYKLIDVDHLVIDSIFGPINWNRSVGGDKSREALSHNNHGVTLGKQGKWDEAIKEHQLAVDEEPANSAFRQNLSAAHLQYGKAFFNDGKYKEAETQYRAAVKVDPENQDAIDGIRDALEKQRTN